MVQVPELDVAVAGGDEVGAVVGEGDGGHLTGHLVGRHQHVFLRTDDHVDVEPSPTPPATDGAPTFQFHTFTIMSCWYPTLMMYFPLGENATQATPYLCSSSSPTCTRSDTSHTRTAGM